jgi:hypothetical protein
MEVKAILLRRREGKDRRTEGPATSNKEGRKIDREDRIG